MKNGYITIFFSLVLMVCMSLFITMLYGVRENAIRMKVRDSMDVSLRSAFGEYQRTLWDRYNLLFVDAGYGNQADSMIISEEHLIQCMNANFDEEWELFNVNDLLKLNCSDAETEEVRFAPDDSGIGVMEQINKWMRFKYGLSDLYDAVILFNEATYLNLFSNPNEAKEEALDAISDEEAPILEEWIEEAKDAIYEEKDVSLLSTLRIIFKDISTISTRELNEELLLSSRDINIGNHKNEDNTTLTNQLVFHEYLLSYCGNYTGIKTDTALRYEVEYFIAGNTSDSKNLENIVNRILLMREAANMITLYSDTEKMSELRTFCEAVMTVLLNPELAPSLELLIVSLWSFAESVCDVKILLDGEKVPLVKEPSQWKTSLADIFIKNNDRNGYENGITYKDYLRMFLYTGSYEDIMERFLNLIESNVRIWDENPEFRLDYCFDIWSATAYINSEYGYDYRIKNAYSYMD